MRTTDWKISFGIPDIGLIKARLVKGRKARRENMNRAVTQRKKEKRTYFIKKINV